jgi:hypothetical protein
MAACLSQCEAGGRPTAITQLNMLARWKLLTLHGMHMFFYNPLLLMCKIRVCELGK